MNLYGYKRCSTCREAQKTLEQHGARVEFHDIVAKPPTEAMIREWLKLSNQPVIEFVNMRGTVYRERDLKNAKFSDDEWVHELSRDGKLLKRPILVTASGELFIGYHEGTYTRLALAEGEQ